MTTPFRTTTNTASISANVITQVLTETDRRSPLRRVVAGTGTQITRYEQMPLRETVLATSPGPGL